MGRLKGGRTDVRTDGRTYGHTDGRTYGKSPHSTGLRPLPGPLPKKQDDVKREDGTASCQPFSFVVVEVVVMVTVVVIGVVEGVFHPL